MFRWNRNTKEEKQAILCSLKWMCRFTFKVAPMAMVQWKVKLIFCCSQFSCSFLYYFVAKRNSSIMHKINEVVGLIPTRNNRNRNDFKCRLSPMISELDLESLTLTVSVTRANTLQRIETVNDITLCNLHRKRLKIVFFLTLCDHFLYYIE